MIRSGAVVIDAGTSEMDGAIVGDVLVSSLTEQPEALAPVPGGVGPLTVYFLMENVVRASEQMK
jgi:methylenetetrahydrofolate dehydrogenase (NADP+)/methenyltetrahydrofolate cyclohydrolase